MPWLQLCYAYRRVGGIASCNLSWNSSTRGTGNPQGRSTFTLRIVPDLQAILKLRPRKILNDAGQKS
jgi:hypothetical protein